MRDMEGRPARPTTNDVRAPALRATTPVLTALALLAALNAPAPAQTVHLLEAGPRTVAWGHYWSETPPVLRIASGDIIDVTTMITSNPQRLEAVGIRPDEVPQALRDIVDQVEDRGPGGHILTGPVYVEGAQPAADRLVRVRCTEAEDLGLGLAALEPDATARWGREPLHRVALGGRRKPSHVLLEPAQ